MYLIGSSKCASIIACLLILSSCAQEDDIDQEIVTEADVTLEVEGIPIVYVSEDKNTEMADQQIAELDDSNNLKTSSTESVFEISKRIAQLQEQFNNCDQNGDGYLALDELPSMKMEWIVEIPRTYDVFITTANGAFVSTATLEHLKQEIEQNKWGGDLRRQITVAVEQRYDYEFYIADANRDRRLSREEYHNKNDRLREYAKREHFPSLDKNQDGFVDWGEYSSVEIEQLRNLDVNEDGIISNDESGGNWLPLEEYD